MCFGMPPDWQRNCHLALLNGSGRYREAAVSNSQFDVELGARQEDGYQPWAPGPGEGQWEATRDFSRGRAPRLVEQHLRAARESKLGELEIPAVSIRHWQSTAIRDLDDKWEI
jgi:hypothetical protein